jgi:ankyrin repeat protein
MFSSISLNTSSTFPSLQPAPIEVAWRLVDEFLKVNNLNQTFQKGNLSPLEIAIELKDLDLCKRIKDIQGGLDPDKPFKESLLIRAIYHSTESIALWLIEEGIDIRIEDRTTNHNVLHETAGLGKISLVKALIEKGMPIDCISKQPFPPNTDLPERLKTPFLSFTPLFFAVSCRQPQMVKILLQLGADINVGHPLLNPFYVAFVHNWQDILQVFCEENVINKIIIDGKPILHHLIIQDEQELLKRLLSLGANVNLPNCLGEPALHVAIQHKHLEATKILVENGANINEKSLQDTHTPLYMAILLDLLDIFKYLLEKGANPDIPGDEEGFTPLHHAALMNKEEFAKILIRYKANVNAIDSEEETPLFKIANRKSHQIASLLLENGAAPNHLNKENKSPLHRAVLHDDIEMARLLIKYGALINAKDCNKNRPLHCASSEEMVDLLLDAGADAHVLNKSADTPLQNLILRSLITDKNFIYLKKKDAGLTEIFHKLRLLGHRFSLEGTWVEGFTTKCTFPEIAASWSEFLATQPARLQDTCKGLSDKFLENSKFDYQDALNADSPVFRPLQNQELMILPVHLQDRKHAMVLTIMNRFVAMGNRGLGAEEPGLAIFEMKHPKLAPEGIVKLLTVLNKTPSYADITKEKKARNDKDSYQSIKTELQNAYTEEAIRYFNQILLEGVGLHPLYYLKQRKQEVGNCAWMAAKMGLLASLIFLFLEETRDLQLAIQQAKSIYKKWSLFDYERSLKNLGEILQEPYLSTDTDLVDRLCTELFLKCIQKKKISWMESILTVRPQLINGSKDAMTFLYKAKDRKIIAWLVSQGIDPLAVDRQDENVLSLAIKWGNLPLVSYLVEECHCNLTKGNQKMTPLMIAICAHQVEIVFYLIAKGADPQEEYAYYYALGNPDMEKVFINYRDCKGRTLLFKETLSSTAGKLIKAGMPLDVVDEEGNTAFHSLCKTKKYLVLEEILNHLSNLDLLKQADVDGNTLLHLLASQVGEYEAQKILKTLISLSKEKFLECASMKNKENLSPLHILLKQPPHYNLCELLEKILQAMDEIDLLLFIDHEGKNLMNLFLSQSFDLMKKITSIIASKTKTETSFETANGPYLRK